MRDLPPIGSRVRTMAGEFGYVAERDEHTGEHIKLHWTDRDCGLSSRSWVTADEIEEVLP